MSKKNPEFLKIQSEWYSILAKDGFEDEEDGKGYLKQYDRRTIAFDNRDELLEFYTALDHYLSHVDNLAADEYEILSLYSKGKYITEICKIMKKSKYLIKKVINRYIKSL